MTIHFFKPNSKVLKLLVVLFLHFNIFTSFAQSDPNLKDYYLWFDTIIGEGNTGLYDGMNIEEFYRTKKDNHNFFKSNNYLTGNLVYNNQPYFNVSLKYDIYNDELHIKLPNQSNHLFIKLFKDKISDFTIENHKFINNSSFQNKRNKDLEFYELVQKSSQIILLKKHRKKRDDKRDNQGVYYKFTSDNYFAILYDDEYHTINSKKDLVQIFPNSKAYILSFYKKERTLLKSNKDTFFKTLISEINARLTNTQSK